MSFNAKRVLANPDHPMIVRPKQIGQVRPKQIAIQYKLLQTP